MGTYYQYGNYAHTAGLVALTVSQQRNYTRRGNAQSTTVRHQLRGEVQGTTQAALNTAITDLESAYALDGRTGALYFEDGTKTKHVLETSTAIGGVRVVSLDYPDGEGAEYSTFRSFEIVLEAEYPRVTNNLIFFTETLSFFGDGGPRNVVLETLTGPPVPQTTAQFTVQRVTQSGRAMNHRNSYPSYPSPLWPQWYQGPLSSTSSTSPEYLNGALRNWGISWNYVFESAVPLIGTPNVGR